MMQASSVNKDAVSLGKWDKLMSWSRVQEEIAERLRNAESYDDGMTLYYGPQLHHTLRNPANIKCMTHFPSNIGDVFATYYRMGIEDQLGIWTLKSTERGAKSEIKRFDITGEVKAFLFVPKHRAYVCFCSDLTMRVYADAHAKCTETCQVQCLSTIRCMAYNRETDDVYVGGVGVLQKWKISGSEHSATAEPGQVFNIDINKDEWVIDIKVDPRNNQLMAVTYEGIFVVNYKSMRQTHHLQNRHGNSLRCCSFYKDREYFITGGGDGTVKVWNSVVFTQVHVFYGHRAAITGLQTHKKDPLLFSSSLDGSVQIWRMDNFSKFMRLDLAEKIYSIKLLGDEDFYCQTESQIRIYSLNQFYNLFAPVESSVYKLQLCQGVKGQPGRIIASTEDGSVRLFSPVTGASLTIIYPMPTFQVLSCFAYSREKNRLHSVLQNGTVLVFNCDTNPCKALEVWTPQTADEEVSNIVQVTLAYEKNDTLVTDTVILGGLHNGQICLLDAHEVVMVRNLQAHQGVITCMETSTDIGETGFKLLETNRRMATGGADNYIQIWELGVKVGKLYDTIDIQLLIKIPCVGMPEHISMYENTISVSTSETADKGKLHMYRMDGQENDLQVTTLQHAKDEDHTEFITAIDKCPLLGLFATASEDGFIKIWNRHNQLIREMSFGEPMHGLCFANARGDLLFGFQNHICTIPLTSYFPKNYLERITRQEFRDEARELPIPYNHKIKPWFDPRNLPKFSLSLDVRTEEKKVAVEPEEIEEIEEDPGVETPVEVQEKFVKEDFIELYNIEKPRKSKTQKSTIKEEDEGRSSVIEEDEIEDVVKEFHFGRRYSDSDQIPLKKMRLERAREERRKSESLYFEKLTPWERDLFKRTPIIAPDGYIPNSIVRKRLGYKIPKTPPVKKKDTWSIESVRVPTVPKNSYKPQLKEEEEHWEEVKARYLQFLDGSSTDGDRSSDEEDGPSRRRQKGGKGGRGRPKNNGKGRGKKKPVTPDSDSSDLEFDDSETVDDSDIFPPGFQAEIGQDLVGGPYSLLKSGSDLKDIPPFNWSEFNWNDPKQERKTAAAQWKSMQTMMRAASTLSNQSTSSSRRGGKKKPKPTTPKYELMSKKFDFHRVDMDFGTPDRTRRSLGTKSRERSKSSFRLTSMVVDEKSTNITFKEGSSSRLGPRKSTILPAVDMDIIRQLLQEDFFKDHVHESPSFDMIIQNLIKMLDTEDADLHAIICSYIVGTHRDIGIPDHYIDRTISRLSLQLAGSNIQIKINALRCLQVMGIDRQDVIATILPFLIDPDEEVRKEAKETLAILAGVVNKDELYDLMESLGMNQQQFDSKEAEEEALKQLAMRLDVPYRSESFTDWINNWVDDASTIYDDSEPDIKLDDIEKAWDCRQHKFRHESLCMTDSASRASTRLRELTFLSRGSRTPIQEQDENTEGEEGFTGLDSERRLRQKDFERVRTDGQLSDRSNRSSSKNSSYSVRDEVDSFQPNQNKDVPLPQGFLTRDEPIFHPSQKEDTRYSSEEEDRFDPRDPNLYKYYKNRYKRETEGTKFSDSTSADLYNKKQDGQLNIGQSPTEDYKAMRNALNKQSPGAGDDVESLQLESIDSHSQVGDAISTIDSGIMSMQDSGIGRDVSDTQSYHSHKISPFMSREKIQIKPMRTHQRRLDSRKKDSHRKHNLSPVKSSSSMTGLSDKSTPRVKDPEWMKFFQTPTALERKRMELVRKEFNDGKMKPGSAMTINYISDNLPTLPGEAGLRLLKSVRVSKSKGSMPVEEKHHKIESIPGKLSVHTKDEDKGQSKFGIIQMQWTTSIPAPVEQDPYPECYTVMSDATSTLGGTTAMSFNSPSRLPAIIEKYAKLPQSFREDYHPNVPGQVYTPDFEWEYPIPPPPPKESRLSNPHIKKEHERYCKYYTLVKKKMQNYSSEKILLPKLEIKKAIPEKLKLPRDITKLSRVSSVLFPPITLNQLISARV